MSKETTIMLGIAALVLIGGIILFIKTGPGTQPQAGKPVDSKSLVLDSSHMTGDKNAKITLVEFGDYQCPACAQYYLKVKEIKDFYKNDKDFNLVFRNFPLSQHPNAQIAAESAEAAGSQGKYWEMHDKLYVGQNDWAENPNPIDIFAGYAQQIGLNVDQFKADVTANKFKDIIDTDQADGTKLQVDSTPTFYLNGEKLSQLPSLADFQAKVDELKKK